MSDLIPERLTGIREREGITMAEASRRLNLSKIGYCRYEYGDRIPSPQMVEIIAQCFGTSASYLTGETDDPSPDYVLVKKEDTPILFELAVECSRDKTEDVCKRLLPYIKLINDSNHRE